MRYGRACSVLATDRCTSVPKLGALLPPFWVERVPLLKETTEKSGYPYSNLSTGGPSVPRFRIGERAKLATNPNIL